MTFRPALNISVILLLILYQIMCQVFLYNLDTAKFLTSSHLLSFSLEVVEVVPDYSAANSCMIKAR